MLFRLLDVTFCVLFLICFHVIESSKEAAESDEKSKTTVFCHFFCTDRKF